MNYKQKQIIANIKYFFKRKRYLGSRPKVKRAVLIVFLVINAIFIWDGIITDLQKDYTLEIKGTHIESNATSVQADVTTGGVVKDVVQKEDEGVKPLDPAEIVDKVWMLESTRGENNYSKCEAEGMVNGMGYGIPGDGTYLCFADHEEEVEIVSGWFERKLEDYTLEQALCLYNLGKPLDSCTYSNNFNLI